MKLAAGSDLSSADGSQGAQAERSETLALMKRLTGREKEILGLVALGFATRQIADALNLSPRTVESHRSAIGSKLGTTSPAELTRFWIEAKGAP